MKVSVVGQGYVGLPLAIAAANSGLTVYGIDVNEEKIARLKKGKSFIEDISDNVIKDCVDSGRYIPTTDEKLVRESEIILICVPTPLTHDHKPDLTALISAVRSGL